MLFKPGTPLYAYEVEKEADENVLYINYLGASFVPNIAESMETMSKVVDYLIKTPNISRVVFVQQRNYSYDFSQISLLQEIANLYTYLIQQEKILSPSKIPLSNAYEISKRYDFLNKMLMTLKEDPLACFMELRNNIISENSALEKMNERDKFAYKSYVRILEKFYSLLAETRLIKLLYEKIDDYKLFDRSVYYFIFRPDIIPNFTFTRLVSQLPKDAEIISQYEIGEGYDSSTVTILKKPEDVKYFYHLMPPEYTLNENHHMLLNLARNVLIEHQPRAEEFVDPERTRQVFFNVSRDLLQELAENQGIKINYNDLNKLAAILVRHTIGFGLIEILLKDKNLQDIVVNAPISQNCIYLRHGDFDECSTNIIPSQEDADSWAAKFRMISGRPLDEANPILDTDLSIGDIRARIAVIQQPLSPSGLSYAIRRHRESPWTLPLFIKNKMINSFSAGLLSFVVDNSRTLLIGGTRSSGKCVDGNTCIQLSDGSIKKIKELAGEQKEKIEDGFIYEPLSEFNVPSLVNMKLSNKKITDVWRRSSPDKIVKIKTRSGKEIITTKEHPYFIYKNGLKNMKAGELKVGEFIASPRELILESKEQLIDLKNSPYFWGEAEDYFILKGKTNSSVVKFPKKLTLELAEFIGLIIGDGHIDSKKLEFFNNCDEIRMKYASLLKLFDVKFREFQSRTTKVIQTTSRVLSNVLSEVFEIPLGRKSDKITIPPIILKADNRILAAFLRGYFDTDGYVPESKRDLELATASKIMSENLEMALLRFGIVVFIKPKKVNGVCYYRVLIRGSFVNNFAKHIGFSQPMKKERLDRINSKTFLENTNVDTIPQGNEIVRELRKNLRLSPKNFRESGKDYWAYENNQYRVSRNWFKKIINFYNKRYLYLISLKNQADVLRRFSNFKLEDYTRKIEELRKALDVSYTQIANGTGYSETGVRKGIQLARMENLQMINKVSDSLEILAKNSSSSNILNLVNELITNKTILNSISIGISLSNFREILNISNEEFASCGVSIMTVSNVFNGIYSPNIKTLQKISKKAVEIYDDSISEGVYNLLLDSYSLANSEIFWDEVSFVEIIDKIDDYVYDLTVEDTHNFVANGLIAHNTSLLGSLMLEIKPKYRIITIEDTPELAVEIMRKLKYDILRMKVRSALTQTTTEVSADEGIRTSLRLGDSCLIIGEVRSSIRGDEEVVIVDGGVVKRVAIKDLENKNLANVYVPTIGFNLKTKISKLSGFIKHPKREKLLKITTKTGREVTVTHDHSLFAPTKDFEIAPVECKDLKEGDGIVIPSFIPCGFNDIDSINVFDYVSNFRVENFETDVRKAIKILGWKKATEICGIRCGDIYNYFRRNQKTNIPFSSYKKLMDSANLVYDIKSLKVKKGTSLILPATIPINNDFCRFLGYYVSEGYYSLKEKEGGSVVITNSVPEIMDDLSNISKNLFNLETKRRGVRGLGSSVQSSIHCLPLAEIISKLGCGRTCYEKRVPQLIFGLSKNKIAAFLRALYSGDGCFTSSKSSGNCVKYSSTSKKLIEDIAYLLLNFGIVATIRNKFPSGIAKHESWILEFKDRKMVETFFNEIGFNRETPKMIIRAWKHTKSNYVEFDKNSLRRHLIKYDRKHRHLFRFLRCSKNYLKEMVLDSNCKVSEKLRTFALGDFFLDKIKKIEEINLKESEYVYDLSVEPSQNFIGGFGGIVLHNSEARALYEAMRIGALANVVAGTIHGASPYGIFDRVVNDLQVPVTSFKATDCVVVANPVKTADGLHSRRRVLQFTEIRKQWTRDPLEEKGFVDLLKYNVDKDELEATEDLINGDSEMIKDIASQVQGWAGNWDAVYDNILLRGKVKQELVNVAEKTKKPEILEAGFNVLSNNMFHQISEKIKEEVGLPLGERVFPEWQKWLMKEVKKLKI